MNIICESCPCRREESVQYGVYYFVGGWRTRCVTITAVADLWLFLKPFVLLCRPSCRFRTIFST